MRTRILVSALSVMGIMLVALPAIAADPSDRSEFGIGLILGEPSGLQGQFFWSRRAAIDVTAAWSWNDWFMGMADFQVYDYFWDAPREWQWFYGLGTYLAVPENEDGTFGVRVPLGIRYHFPHSAVDAFAEVAPALQVLPDTEAEFFGGLGVTFWLW